MKILIWVILVEGVIRKMKKKENIIIIIVLVVMILAIVGVSYAAFSYSKTGEKVNSITTGSITIDFLRN